MVNRRVASSMLTRYGAIVSTVNGGVEAVNAVKNQKIGKEFDLVLMDIQMPEVYGLLSLLVFINFSSSPPVPSFRNVM